MASFKPEIIMLNNSVKFVILSEVVVILSEVEG